MRAALCSATLTIGPYKETRLAIAERRLAQVADGRLQPDKKMNALFFLHQKAHTGAKPRARGRHALKALQVSAGIIGLCGGVTVAVLGSLLTAAGWLASNARAKQWLATAGTVLLCSTIPLIVLGACCLDWLELDETPGWSQTRRDEDEGDEL